mgnify:CR=1 FL=1
MYSLDEVKKVDPEVAQAIIDEENRQNSHIELIASENWVSKAVMAAMGSPLTNKYAEGYPGKRYYGGCECVDVIENLAIERAKKLFGCDYANVQPHSGAQANMAVQFAVLKPGDTIMGMNLDHGGHLTHGSPVNMSGKYFHVVPYGVDDNGFLDYDRMRELALECRPKMIIAGASAYARTIDFKKFREVADEVGAVLMVDMAHIAGLVAAGLHPSPIPYADVVTTTTHKTLRGPRGGLILTNFEVHDFKTGKDNFDAFYYGQDFGYNHADAILGVGWKDGEVYICSEIYVFEKDTEEIISLAKQNKVDQRVEMFCDSAEPDRIKTWSKAGFRAYPVKKEPGSVKAQIDWLKGRKIHIHPSCVNVLKEVQQWKWKKDPTSGLYIDEPVEFMDDAMAALRYSVERLRRGSSIEVLK